MVARGLGGEGREARAKKERYSGGYDALGHAILGGGGPRVG